MPATSAPAEPKISHEHYCMPRPGQEHPRIESFNATRVDRNGADAGSVRVTRCIECGSARYTNEEGA